VVRPSALAARVRPAGRVALDGLVPTVDGVEVVGVVDGPGGGIAGVLLGEEGPVVLGLELGEMDLLDLAIQAPVLETLVGLGDGAQGLQRRRERPGHRGDGLGARAGVGSV